MAGVLRSLPSTIVLLLPRHGGEWETITEPEELGARDVEFLSRGNLRWFPIPRGPSGSAAILRSFRCAALFLAHPRPPASFFRRADQLLPSEGVPMDDDIGPRSVIQASGRE